MQIALGEDACATETYLSEKLRGDPGIPRLGGDPKELKTDPNKYLYTNVHSSAMHSSQKVEITQMFNDK